MQNDLGSISDQKRLWYKHQHWRSKVSIQFLSTRKKYPGSMTKMRITHYFKLQLRSDILNEGKLEVNYTKSDPVDHNYFIVIWYQLEKKLASKPKDTLTLDSHLLQIYHHLPPVTLCREWKAVSALPQLYYWPVMVSLKYSCLAY